MSFKEVKELRKDGQLDEALKLAQDELTTDPDDIWNKRALAWVHHDFLKKYAISGSPEEFLNQLDLLIKLDLPQDEAMVFDTIAWQIGKFIYRIAKGPEVNYKLLDSVFDLIKDFQFTKPSEQYTFIYKAFHKGYKVWDSYLEFADWWDFSNFRTQDYLKEEYNGKRLMSIVEQAYIAYSRKLLECTILQVSSANSQSTTIKSSGENSKTISLSYYFTFAANAIRPHWQVRSAQNIVLPLDDGSKVAAVLVIPLGSEMNRYTESQLLEETSIVNNQIQQAFDDNSWVLKVSQIVHGEGILPVFDIKKGIQAHQAGDESIIITAFASQKQSFSNKEITKEKVEEFLSNLDFIIDQHPEYQYPPFFKAKLLLAIGEKNNLISTFLPFAKQKRNEFWVWDLMADIFENEEKIRLACHCKALSLNPKEDYVTSIRQKLATLLIEEKRYEEAKVEIEKLVKARTDRGWKIPDIVKYWVSQNWYETTPLKRDNNDFYIKHIQTADEILFRDIPEEVAVVEFVNTSKKILNFIISKSKQGFFNYDKLLSGPKIGDIIKVRLSNTNQNGYYKAYTAKRGEDIKDHPAIKLFTGELKIFPPNNFGLVEGVFIHSSLIEANHLENSENISGTALLSFNKKKEEWGWKAIEIMLKVK